MPERTLFLSSLAVLSLAVLGGCGADSSAPNPAVEVGAPPRLQAADTPSDPGFAELVASRTRAVEAAPASAEAWGALGIAFDAHQGIEGDFGDEALECYGAAAQLDPSSFRWPYLAATIVYTSDQAAAIEWLDRALASDPEQAQEYGPLILRRGIGQLALGELESAKADYRKATALDSGLVLGWLGLASVALAEDDPEAALAALGRAEEASPVTDEIHGLYAESFRRLGRSDEASLSLARMEDGGRREPIPDRLRAEVDSMGVSLGWGRARAQTMLKLGRPDDAIAAWSTVIEGADSLEAQLGLADLYMTLGRNERAKAIHSQIDARVDSADATASERGQLLFQRGVLALGGEDTTRGEALFKEALDADAGHELARGTLGLLEFGRGETSGLGRVRAAAKALGPYSDMQFNLLRILEEAQLWGELGAALDEFEEARGVTQLTRYARARLFVGQERFDEAAAAFHRIQDLEPTNESAVTNAARAERMMGREAVALATLRSGYERLRTPKVQALSPGAGRNVGKDLSWNLSTTPDPALIASEEAKAEALALSQELLALSPSNPELMDLVAAAEAANANFEQAILHLEAALKILAKPGDQGVPPAAERYAEQIRERLAAYRTNRRWTRS